jgi:hypothetical protein
MHPLTGLTCFIVAGAFAIGWGLTVPNASALYYAAIPLDAAAMLIQLGLYRAADLEFRETQRNTMRAVLQAVVALLWLGASTVGWVSVFVLTDFVNPLDRGIWSCAPLIHAVMIGVDPFLSL